LNLDFRLTDCRRGHRDVRRDHRAVELLESRDGPVQPVWLPVVQVLPESAGELARDRSAAMAVLPDAARELGLPDVVQPAVSLWEFPADEPELRRGVRAVPDELHSVPWEAACAVQRVESLLESPAADESVSRHGVLIEPDARRSVPWEPMGAVALAAVAPDAVRPVLPGRGVAVLEFAEFDRDVADDCRAADNSAVDPCQSAAPRHGAVGRRDVDPGGGRAVDLHRDRHGGGSRADVIPGAIRGSHPEPDEV